MTADPLKDLSPQQLEAVTHEGGPLIVLAGPGTGKTRVITRRVARLVAQSAAPESVVAVTYTTRAAGELRERLADLLGGPRADAVTAHTFHALAMRLVRRFADALDLPSELTIMDAAQERRLLRELVRTHSLYPDHRAVGRETIIERARSTIARLAQQAISAADAARVVDQWRQRLDRNEFPTELLPDSWQGKLPPTLYEREQRALLSAFESSVRLYGLFRASAGARGLLTYDDLILRAVELLRDHDAARAILHAEFRHFVVDEFQDVNAAQIEFLRALAPPTGDAARGPDLCVVGDDDQAIYAFRGADERAFQKFSRLWSNPRTVRLEENRRSAPPIVRASNAIIGRARARFDPGKLVRPAPGPEEPTARVEGVVLDDDGQSGDTIAAMILADRHASAAQSGAPRPWSDFAVIARAHDDLDRVADALHAEGIPVWRGRRQSPLEDQGVQDLLRWARVLTRDDRHALQALLLRPPRAIPFAQAQSWNDAWARERALREETREPRHEGARAFLAFIRAQRGAHHEALASFARTLDEMQTLAAPAPAHEALAQLIRLAALAHAELLPGPERARRIANLAAILRLAREKHASLEEPAGLPEFLAYLDDLGNDARTLAGEDHLDAQDSTDAPDREAVTLVTAHSAKGLEFDTVFVIKVRPRGFPGHKQGEPDLPDWFTADPSDARTSSDRFVDEQRRLFYVAITRAERRLVLLAKNKKSRGKAIDYFEELTLDEKGIVEVISGADAMAHAARLGVRVASTLASDPPHADLGTRQQRRRDLLERARREARLLAADALDEASRPEALDAARSRLDESALRLAIIASLEGSAGEDSPPALPAWIESAPDPLRVFVRRLLDAWGSGEPDRPRVFPPLPPPLRLSYSHVEEYRRCPRCFYLRRILRWPEESGREQTLGTVVHEALAAYHEERLHALADSRPMPGTDWALRRVRDRFFARSLGPPDRDELDRALAQVRAACEDLPEPGEQVERVEFFIRFPYAHAGQTHHFEAKLDRLDLIPDAPGHRIIDYKTGHPSPRLLSPERTDLQLGVYALALASHQGIEDADARAVGTAEYWVLATPARGRIDLADLAMDKIRATINSAIDGMLAGDWSQGSGSRDGCWGLCHVLGD